MITYSVALWLVILSSKVLRQAMPFLRIIFEDAILRYPDLS